MACEFPVAVKAKGVFFKAYHNLTGLGGFHAPSFGPSFSGLAFSCGDIRSCIFRSCIFWSSIFSASASGRPLVYQVTQIIPYKESRGRGAVGLVGSVRP